VRLNPDVPHKLEDIITKALEKDRNLRYQHAADMRTDLQQLKRGSESARVPAATSAAAKSHLGIWKLISPVAIVVLAVSGYFYLHRTPKLSDKDTVVLVERLMEHRLPLEKIYLERKVRPGTPTGNEWQSSSG
jgi:hypothetical protein